MLPPRTSIVRIAYEVYSIGCANAKKVFVINMLKIPGSRMAQAPAPLWCVLRGCGPKMRRPGGHLAAIIMPTGYSMAGPARSEERRVGKECRSRGSTED